MPFSTQAVPIDPQLTRPYVNTRVLKDLADQITNPEERPSCKAGHLQP